DLVDHPDARARHGDQAEHHHRHAAQHGAGYRLDQGAEFGREPQHNGDERGHHEDQGGVDARHGHDADVLGIGDDAGAAHGAGHHAGHPVAHEAAAQVAVGVLAGHGADGADVSQVLGHEDDGHRHDQHHGIEPELGGGELRQAHPGSGGHGREIDRVAEAAGGWARGQSK